MPRVRRTVSLNIKPTTHHAQCVRLFSCLRCSYLRFQSLDFGKKISNRVYDLHGPPTNLRFIQTLDQIFWNLKRENGRNTTSQMQRTRVHIKRALNLMQELLRHALSSERSPDVPRKAAYSSEATIPCHTNSTCTRPLNYVIVHAMYYDVLRTTY